MMTMFVSLCLEAMDCFTRESSIEMNLDAGLFNLFLTPMVGSNCNLPEGVFLEFSFTDSSLDFFQVVNDFNYNEAQHIKVLIDTTLNAEYEKVENVVLNVSSFNVESVFSIGKIENMRIQQLSADDDNYFKINITHCCFHYSREFGSDSLSKTIVLYLQNGQEHKIEPNIADAMSLCSTENVQKYLREGIVRVTLSISGELNGVYTEDEYETTEVELIRVDPIYKPSSLIVYYDTHIVLILKPETTFPFGMINASIKPIQFCLSITFTQGEFERVCGNIDGYELQYSTRLLEKDFDDKEQYHQLLEKLKTTDPQTLSVLFELFFQMPGSMVAFQAKLGIIATVCFTNVYAHFSPKEMKITLSLNPLMEECALRVPGDTEIKIGQYLTAEDEMKNEAGLTVRFEATIDEYSLKGDTLVIPITKQEYKELSKHLDGQTNVAIFFLREDKWVDDADIEGTEFEDKTTESVLIVVISLSGIALIIVVSTLETVFLIHCSRKGKKAGSKHIGELDDL